MAVSTRVQSGKPMTTALFGKNRILGEPDPQSITSDIHTTISFKIGSICLFGETYALGIEPAFSNPHRRSRPRGDL